MFSKSRINEPGPKQGEGDRPRNQEAPVQKPSTEFAPGAPKPKPSASVLSSDLTVVGNLRTTGDIQVEGTVEGDIRAHLLTVGESATMSSATISPRIVALSPTVSRWARISPSTVPST